jgi:hypothetical protein
MEEEKAAAAEKPAQPGEERAHEEGGKRRDSG